MHLVFTDSVEVIESAIAYGAKIDVRNNNGHTALDIAKGQGKTNAANILHKVEYRIANSHRRELREVAETEEKTLPPVEWSPPAQAFARGKLLEGLPRSMQQEMGLKRDKENEVIPSSSDPESEVSHTESPHHVRGAVVSGYDEKSDVLDASQSSKFSDSREPSPTPKIGLSPRDESNVKTLVGGLSLVACIPIGMRWLKQLLSSKSN